MAKLIIDKAYDFSTSAPARRIALDRFEALLSAASSEKPPKEQDWQALFEENPFILSDTIPIHFDRLISQFRFNSGPVDFLFQKSSDSPLFTTTGLIEIKRPDHKILDIYGAHMNLARSASRAIIQLKDYMRDLESGLLLEDSQSFAIGNSRFAFVIIGLSNEISKKCYSEINKLQFQRLLPAGFQILTFDLFLNNLKSSIPPKILFLTAGKKSHSNFHVIIVSGATGAGKSTVVRNLVDLGRQRGLSISILKKYTTRKPRNFEREGEELYFLSQNDFIDMERQDRSFFSYEIYDSYYWLDSNHLFDLAGSEGLGFVILPDIEKSNNLYRVLNFHNISSAHIHLHVDKDTLIRRLQYRDMGSDELEKRFKIINRYSYLSPDSPGFVDNDNKFVVRADDSVSIDFSTNQVFEYVLRVIHDTKNRTTT